VELREALNYLVAEEDMPVAKGCRCVGLSRSVYYRRPVDWRTRNHEIIEVFSALLEEFPRSGSGNTLT
jgi:hypothetical protein